MTDLSTAVGRGNGDRSGARSVSRPGAARTLRLALAPCARLGLLAAALLLLYTGMVKVSDIAAFARTLESHSLLPAWSVATFSIAVPSIEIILGAGVIAALAFSRGLAVAAIAQAALFLAFMIYAGVINLRPPPEPTGCGCGLRAGPIEDWTPLVIQNGLSAAALAMAGMALAGTTARRSTGR